MKHAGSFFIEGLTRGEYSFGVMLGNGAQALYGGVSFTITDHDIDGVNMTFGPTASLTGVVRMAEDGVALPKTIAVVLMPAGAAGTARRLAAPASVQDGRFHVDGIAPGNYWPTFLSSSDGYALLRGDGRPLGLYGSAEVTFVMTSKPAAIVGTVVDENQRPVPGATVELVPDLAGEFADRFMNTRIVSGASGEFRFSDVAPGKYTVNGVPVEVGPGQTVTVTVHRVKT